MKNIFIAVACLGAALLSGCVTAPPSDATTIQGTWKGQEVRDGQAAASWLTLVGNELEFRGADHNEWYKGTYTLNEKTDPKQFIGTITFSPASAYVGKTVNAIYELIPGPQDQATLILTGNEPGDPQMPSGFADHHARQIVFTRD